MSHPAEEVGSGELAPLEVSIAKNRFGRLGRVSMDWAISNGRIVEA